VVYLDILRSKLTLAGITNIMLGYSTSLPVDLLPNAGLC
jgi:hypothetical protein